ncbi:MAG: alpha/beta hydrolase, partial [Parvularculaceae bacterium]|nr:alpha/beta hydrolase [Parvularculaceae bacterium]
RAVGAAWMTRPLLLRLPGNMCDARLWSALKTPEGWRVLDLPLTEDDRLTAMAERALRAAPGPLIPVGFSMGGLVALDMARLAPGRVKGLVLIDTTADADLKERSDLRLDQQTRVAQGALRTVVRDELKPNYLALSRRSDVALKDLLVAMAEALGPEVFVRQSEALRTRPDNRATLAAFEGPVLIVCGAEDSLITPDRHRAMAAACRRPTLTLHVVENAGHMLPLEQPDRLSAAIADWLDANEETLIR